MSANVCHCQSVTATPADTPVTHAAVAPAAAGGHRHQPRVLLLHLQQLPGEYLQSGSYLLSDTSSEVVKYSPKISCPPSCLAHDILVEVEILTPRLHQDFHTKGFIKKGRKIQ